VISRSRLALATAVGLWLAPVSFADEPARSVSESGRSPATLPELSNNQNLADSIAAQLRRDSRLRQYNIDIVVQDGIARLSGVVANGGQRDEALRIAREVPGVAKVQDSLVLAGFAPVMQVQARAPMPAESTPKVDAPPAQTDPLPAGTGPSGPFDFAAPKMPPYAWPTYAPYNNYSRVATPLAYPYNAWPFIGPIYPFPKVPLGWRSVKLEFDDGYWWFGKTATKYNWWHLRYW
jgi:hypothetical protein